AVRKIGPVRLAIVSSARSPRIVTLERIREGAIDREIYRPSVVADPTADKAHVVGGLREPVATVNLRTLAVSYRRPFPSADGSDVSGTERMTVWLGGGRFAVAGFDNGWRARTLDPDTDFFCVAGHSLVGHHVDGILVVVGYDGVRRLTLTPPAAFPVPVAS